MRYIRTLDPTLNPKGLLNCTPEGRDVLLRERGGPPQAVGGRLQSFARGAELQVGELQGGAAQGWRSERR